MKPESEPVKKPENEAENALPLGIPCPACSAPTGVLCNAEHEAVHYDRRQAAELLESIRSTDGREIHREDWRIAQALESHGLITLGPGRGPNRDWRRAEVV